MLTWLGYRTWEAAWKVVDRETPVPYWVDAGRFVRSELHDNAVLLYEEHHRCEHLTAMFYTDRTCYAMQRGDADQLAQRIVQAGGEPYLVTHQKLPLPSAYVVQRHGPTIYRWGQAQSRPL